MPELPDLEVFKDNVFGRIFSKKLISVSVWNQKKVNALEDLLSKQLEGRELLGISRFGKELYFNFEDNHTVAVHLMLSGEISILPKGEAKEIKSKIFGFHFEEQSVVFSDRSNMLTVKYRPLRGTVPDAMGEKFTLEYFIDKAKRNGRANVKEFLIDQHTVKGIGNAYADEILWTARISPRSQVGKIPEDALTALYGAISTVLREAIESIRRIAPDIISGEERSFLKVHNREIKETETGYPILVEKIGPKTTYYTKEQIIYW